MLSVWYVQFYQVMIISSLVVSLLPVAILALLSQSESTSSSGVCKNIVNAAIRIIVCLAATIALNIIIKVGD